MLTWKPASALRRWESSGQLSSMMRKLPPALHCFCLRASLPSFLCCGVGYVRQAARAVGGYCSAEPCAEVSRPPADKELLLCSHPDEVAHRRAMGEGRCILADCSASVRRAAAVWLQGPAVERLRISLGLCMSLETGARSLNRPTCALLSAYSTALSIVALDKVI